MVEKNPLAAHDDESREQTTAGKTAAGRELAARAAAGRRLKDAKRKKVWCAYNADGSCFVLFGQEPAALRYAVDNHLDGCRPVEYGVPLLDQIK